MSAFALIKDIWNGCKKREIVGWIVFVTGFSLLFSHFLLWDLSMDYSKTETSFLLYRFCVTIFFTALSGMGVYLGYKGNSIGWHQTEEDAFWRAFMGGTLFSTIQVMSIMAEGLIVGLRHSQLLETIQGVMYVGTLTGCGMVWYLYLIGYVRKKKR